MGAQRSSTVVIRATCGALMVGAMVLAGCGAAGSQSSSSATGVKGSSEVTAAPVSTAGPNPFTATVGKDMSGVQAPAAAAGAGPARYRASLPGLYGGTRNYTTCDANKLVNFLQANPKKAAAWAAALGVRTAQIRTYVSSLTDVILRTDTRVTNHGYEDGIAIPIQSVLQASTAVFIDKYGSPVVKCYCGNPLTPPVLYRAPTYTGPLWTGFSTTNITIINQSTTVIKEFTLYDPANGQTFTRTAGVHGHDGPYSHGPTTPQQTSSTTTTGTTPTQTASPAQEHASVSLSPNPATQGDTVTLTASGFASGASLQITVNRPDGVVEHYPLSAGPNGSGTYTFSNAAGNAPLGTYSVTVMNTASGASASGSVEVIAPPPTTSSQTSTTSTTFTTTTTS